MKINIFQIDSEKDKHGVMYQNLDAIEGFQGTKDIQSEIYDKVFDGDVDCNTLEDVYKLEIMEKEYEYKLKQQESEAENTAKYGAMKDVFGGLIGGMFTSAMNTPEVQQQMSSAFADAFMRSSTKTMQKARLPTSGLCSYLTNTKLSEWS